MQRLAILVILVVALCVANKDQFEESLLIRPLVDGKILLHFQFRTSTQEKNILHDQYELFPKSFGQTMNKFAVQSLHLHMTQGRWFYHKWGVPMIPAPVGAELYTTFNQTVSTYSPQWKGLVHALSGLFCASFNFLDIEKTPVYAAGHVSPMNAGLYATLSRETVCTENLTPFKKLLPSRAKSGLGTLLNPLKLYDVHFHTMGIHFEKRGASYELVQTVSIVVDLLHGQTRREWQNWNLKELLNVKTLRKAFKSPLANNSTLYLHFTDSIVNRTSEEFFFDVNLPFEKQTNNNNGQLYFLNLKNVSKNVKDIHFTWSSKVAVPFQYPSQTVLEAHRYQIGFGNFKGGFVVRMVNHGTKPVAVHFYDSIPWYFRVYFHTFKVSLNDKIVDTKQQFSKLSLIPGIERETPAVVEFVTIIPPGATLLTEMDFDKVFLRYSEHSPDANRGFDFSSSLISYYELDSNVQLQSNSSFVFEWQPFSHGTMPQTLRCYTESLLITLPTPDFSMPYNVITLSSTVVALFFGSLFNSLIRRYRQDREDAKKKKEGTLEPPKLLEKMVTGIKNMVEGTDDDKKNK